jgi:hypothetical protein
VGVLVLILQWLLFVLGRRVLYVDEEEVRKRCKGGRFLPMLYTTFDQQEMVSPRTFYKGTRHSQQFFITFKDVAMEWWKL